MPIAIVSHYGNNGSLNADGTTYGGHRIAGPRRFPLGTRVRLHNGDQVFVGVICDRLNRRYDSRFDLPSRSSARFRRGRDLIRVYYEILSRPKKKRRHHGSSNL